MSYDTSTPDSPASTAPRRFPALIATTVALLFATILLGVATKATGAGLACNANWPLCDGGILNLFPASFPSFFEWIHRVVAMVAGFAIVGTAVLAWRGGTVDGRVRYAVTAGLVLLPIQVILGRETVIQYDLEILSAHYWTAIAIFTLFVVAAVLVLAGRITAGHVHTALWTATALVPVQVALSNLFIGRYTPPIQTAQYAVTLSLIACVVLAAVVGRRRFEGRRLLGLFAVTPGLAVLVMLFGRQAVISYAPAMDYLYVATAAALFSSVLAGALLARRR